MTTKKTKYLDPNLIERGISEVMIEAVQYDIRIALVGGAALQLFGSDRLTTDVDFVCEAHIPSLPKAKSLTFGGWQSRTPSGIPVDLITRNDDFASLYSDALMNAINVQDVPVKVIAPEYLVAMKMVAGRKKDEADLEFLLGATEHVDMKKARVIVKKFLGAYGAQEFDQTLEIATWIKSKS